MQVSFNLSKSLLRIMSSEEETRISHRLKRFDDVFKMLLLVMTITTSIGFTTYSGITLWGTLIFLVMALGLWSLGHLTSIQHLEIVVKLFAWSATLLVTTSTFAKFALKVSTLDDVTKIPVAALSFILTFAVYLWFRSSIPLHTRRRYIPFALLLPLLYFGGYVTF